MGTSHFQKRTWGTGADVWLLRLPCIGSIGWWEILLPTVIWSMRDVHLFMSSDPTRCVAEIVNRLKGASSRILREEFPHLKSRLPTLWSRSYYAGTVGHVSEATVVKYIEK